MAESIISRIRREAYSDGLRQINGIACDEAHYEGYCEGIKDAEATAKWSAGIAFVAGCIASSILWSFLT